MRLFSSLVLSTILLFNLNAYSQSAPATAPAAVITPDQAPTPSPSAGNPAPSAASAPVEAAPSPVQNKAAPALQLNADKVAKQGGVDVVPPSGGAANTPILNNFESQAEQAILIDFDTDTVLYEKNSTQKMFPSSMTKVLTLYLVFDQLKKGHITMDTEFVVSERAWKTGGSQMFLKVGDRVKVSDLIQGVIVQSGNDACIALAEGISGSVEAFVEDMNTVAKQLGMNNTYFQNPDGLPVEGHFTTAQDLSIAAKHMINDFPEYYHYYSQREFTYGGIKQQNRNKLLEISDLGIDGMKTGFTEMGGYGMIATGVRDGRRVLAVVNGLKTVKERLSAAEALIRYGYGNFKNIKLFNKYDALGKVKIWGGVEASVAVAPASNVEILVSRRDYNYQNYKIYIAYKEPWEAPVKKGAHMANLIVKDAAGKIVKQYPLYAIKDVREANIYRKLIQKAKYLIGRK